MELLKRFFARNLDARGRWIRAVGGVAMMAGGLVLCRVEQHAIAFVVLASGGLVLFEAARGWCVLRACGVRTRL